MCCNSSSQTNHSGNCGCQSKSCFAPALWSKKRQIQYAKNSIACLQSQVKELEDKLDELENAK